MNESVYLVFTPASTISFEDRKSAEAHASKFERVWVKRVLTHEVARQLAQKYPRLDPKKVGKLNRDIFSLSNPRPSTSESKRHTVYCVFRGQKTGITSRWTKAKAWIGNHGSPYYRKFASMRQATMAFSRYHAWEKNIKGQRGK
jgi:hypothetical protein